jgi:hypothetical protein
VVEGNVFVPSDPGCNIHGPDFFRTFSPELADCDLIFIDGPKNIIFEKTLFAFLENIRLKKDMVMLVDDIRVWNMLAIWRNIARPKLDITSFGHWSGTGLIDWNGVSRT